MAHKQGQEFQANYLDGMHVKISERYKPPPRINVVITYSQRLSLNKQLSDTIPIYDFILEANVKEKLKELKYTRKIVREQRSQRLEKIKSDRLKKKDEEKSIQKENNEEIVTTENKNEDFNEMKGTEKSYELNGGFYYQPTVKTTSYSSILTPIPLANVITTKQSYTCAPTDKSPFNISDFEADTSSPFDNMELQTLNDMEELAQVLKSDNKTTTGSQIYQGFSPVQSVSAHSHQNFGNYLDQGLNVQQQQNVYSILPGTHSFIQQSNALENNYFYPVHTTTSYTNSYVHINKNEEEQETVPTQTSFRSVPDIMKALESELNSAHIDDMQIKNAKLTQPNRPKSTDSVYSKSEVKCVDLIDPYSSLPVELQELSKSISSMGFPLPRVARACKALGADHKKVVEHLLAMSELLDLGFSETEVSNALLQSNNDRDKALDKLIL